MKINYYINKETALQSSGSRPFKRCFWKLAIYLSLFIFFFCHTGLQAHNLNNGELKKKQTDSTAPSIPSIPIGLLTTPKTYHAPMAGKAIVIDGDLNDAAWQNAPWSDDFSDIAGNSVLKNVRIDRQDQILPTQVKMCWDDTYLYIAAKLTDPDLWATLKKRDTIIYNNNDYEVFFSTASLANSYYELEINQLGTILDLLMTRPYRNRGQALIHWDLKGLKSAVKLHGTLNNSADKDSGWTVEMAIPYKGVLAFGQRRPQAGDYWRINFSRVQWDAHPTASGYQRNKGGGRLLSEHNWVWSPQGIVNMHAPDRWGYLFFVKDSTQKEVLPMIELQKAALWKIYYAEQYRYAKRHKFALTLAELSAGDSRIELINPQNGKTETYWLGLSAGDQWFRVCLKDEKGQELLALDQNGALSVFK